MISREHRLAAFIVLASLAVILLDPTTGAAMHTTVQTNIVAVSTDGRSVLVASRAHGPEGGGSYSVSLYSADQPNELGFVFSSDFSPGDGSTPESISAAACGAALAKLGKALAAKKFRGVKVATSCAQRSGLVTVDDAERARTAKLEVAPDAFDVKDKTCRIRGAGGAVDLTLVYAVKSARVFASPDLRVILVLDQGDGWGATALAGVWVVPGDFPQSLKSIYPPRP